jgi:NADH dehydrogenase (ubiquinone) 1 beta subcomplex subunit 7
MALCRLLDRTPLLSYEPQTERHTYEKCQYEEFKKRVAKMDELRAEKAKQAAAAA